MRKQTEGFTLVELIVVIVILGILAATALPRFINVQTEARRAAVEGIAGGLRGSVAAVQARWFVSGGSGVSAVSAADGTTIDVVATSGVPQNTSTGIQQAMNCEGPTQCQGITVSGIGGASSTWTPTSGGAGCQVIFNPTGSPVVQANIGSC